MKSANPAASALDPVRARPTRGIVSLLAALAAIGALSTNIILPSFPAIGAELVVSDAQLGLTLSAFFIVFAVGQIIGGPISGRYGRRKLVIGGLVLFSVGGVLCALASDITTLTPGGAVQAAGVCAADARHVATRYCRSVPCFRLTPDCCEIRVSCARQSSWRASPVAFTAFLRPHPPTSSAPSS